LRGYASNVSIVDCRGVGWIFLDIKASIKVSIAGIHVKFSYIYVVPVKFVHAGTPAGAAECIRQLLAVSEDALDSHSL